jgi:hypothetical protein
MRVEKSFVTEDWLHSLQLQDESVRKIKEILDNPTSESGADSEKEVRKHFITKNERVCRKEG